MISLVKPLIGKEEKDAVARVLDSGQIAQGPVVKAFEDAFAQFCGVKHAVAVNNGTAALHTALASLGIGKGDEVITTPFTFIASANTILMQQAKPVFVDVEKDYFHIDTQQIEDAITEKTKAIMSIDLYGQVYDNKGLKDVADQHQLKIVEDACQAVGATQGNKKAGHFGNAGCFSFYATKNMTTGEGGMVVTDDEKIAAFARQFRHHGQGTERYAYNGLGYNYRMTDMQAALGIEQLKKVDGFNEKRIQHAAYFSQELSKFTEISVPQVREGNKHVYHQYTLKVDSALREKIILKFKEKGIGYGIYYPQPLHTTPLYLKLGYQNGDFPLAEQLSEEVLSLPIHPLLTQEELQTIVTTIGESL